MTAPAQQSPGFVKHDPSVKHTNADDVTSFTMFCITSFPSSCCSAVLFLEEPNCVQLDGFSKHLTNAFSANSGSGSTQYTCITSRKSFYRKTCVKRSLIKRQNKDFNNKW